MSKQSFSKFIRPEVPTSGPITDRDIDIIDAVLRYRFISAAQLVRLVGGNEDVTHRRLRRLWERGLVNRWAFPGIRTHSEFYYYLDKRVGLFWFTISTLFTGDGTKPARQALPLSNSRPYLNHPEIILQPIWALPDRTRHTLSDAENFPAPTARR